MPSRSRRQHRCCKSRRGRSGCRDFLAKLAAATDDAGKAVVLADYASAVNVFNGYLFNKGAIDFAGGSVVHINAGVAGLVCAVMLGKRVGLGREAMAPHNLTVTLLGTGLLMFGWFGFSAGSNLEANGLTGLALLNTILGAAAATLAWVGCEWLTRGHASLLGAASGPLQDLWPSLQLVAGWDQWLRSSLVRCWCHLPLCSHMAQGQTRL